MVVESEEFIVNKMVKTNHILDKYHGLLEDPVQRPGLKLKKTKLKNLTEKNISATKSVLPSPIGQFSS